MAVLEEDPAPVPAADSTSGASDDEITVEETSFVHTEPPQDGTAPPVVTSDMEVLNDKVKKQVIKEGHGKKPSRFATCFVHYRAWVQGSSHKFEDTWQEQHPIELVLGKEKKEMTGLGIGVSNMRSGERALLHVNWELGYGKEGSFSFPNVPPMADLVYEVELIGFDDVKEGKARSDMTVEERIEAADRRKIEGNEYFKEKKFEEAMQQYEMAIAYMGDDFMFQLFGKYRDMALAVKNPCHLNMAACLIKLKRFDEAIAQCTIVLSEDENNVKALFRRGKARAELGQTESAREDFLKAKKYSPEDKEIQRELRSLAEQDKALYQKQKELYKGLFGPRPEPKPKASNFLVLFWRWLVSLIGYLPHAASNGSKPADLKDLIAGLYGSQPLSSPVADEAGEEEMVPVVEDGDEFGDDGWEFKAAPSSDRGRANGDGIESTGPNDAAILDLYKETELVDAVHMTQSSSESVQSPSDMFSNNEMNSSFETDENHSIKSSSDRTLIDFYHKLREETLTVIFRNRKDFKEICEKLPEALEDMSLAVELYKHSVSTLHTLEQASKEEQRDYVRAWYRMLLFCAQELQHGVVLWQESCQSNVCNVVISQGDQFFIALGEIYRVAQILNLSLQSFKPWVLADPGMVSKMLVCWDGCLNAWTNNGLGTALRMVVDSNNLDAPVAKVLLESIIKIDEIEVATLQCSLPNSKMTCRHTLLPTSVLPGMEVIIWDGDHYFVKVANLWTNRISSDPPQFSHSYHLNK
uniref:peptidylprolyl isomerase n=1 Tax=Oryza barthii TaxID=65489 RepID=A0A0D3HRE5_9ORYZ